jgi:hypothetical protein
MCPVTLPTESEPDLSATSSRRLRRRFGRGAVVAAYARAAWQTARRRWYGRRAGMRSTGGVDPYDTRPVTMIGPEVERLDAILKRAQRS